METTRHYLDRALERYGLDEVEAIKLMKKASLRGKTVSEMQSREKKYMAAKEEAAGCISVLYQEKIFIFSPWDNCITVYDCPEWFGKKRYYDGKKKLKHAKKYARYYASVRGEVYS